MGLGENFKFFSSGVNFKFGENFRFEGKFWFWVKILGSGEHFLWKVPIGSHGFMGSKYKLQSGRFYVFKFLVKILGWD